MTSATIFEAKTNLSELIKRRKRRGGRHHLGPRKNHVARLTPIAVKRSRTAESAFLNTSTCRPFLTAVCSIPSRKKNATWRGWQDRTIRSIGRENVSSKVKREANSECGTMRRGSVTFFRYAHSLWAACR